MTEIHNFSLYLPDDENLLKLNALFLKSEDGRDWYESQQLFSPDSVKVVFNQADGVIVSFSRDVSTLWPVGLSVAEVSEWPKEAAPNRKWCFIDGEVVPRIYTADELREQAIHKRDYLLEQAAKIIAPLQDAVDLDMATEAEKAALLAWKKYRVLLNRVDISTVPDIDWPELPQR
ncbi:tail fiber assembly protein [Arsenophonus sp. PmNCSU2021_1]|uniref:tail fiber assembly protein n=1 Tax=Arsenophonus sp. PmNCSU2021_1 TaxID=3118989 RepID=UPI002FEF0F8D